MNKLKLDIHSGRHGGTLGRSYLMNGLKESGLFEMGTHDHYVNAPRGMRGTTLFCEGKKIYLDFWEYPAPTFSNKVYDEDFDLIIQLQHREVPLENVHRYLNRKNILPKTKEELTEFLKKIVPWTFFPSRLFTNKVGQEEELQVGNAQDELAFFCGKPWKCRKKIMKSLTEQGIETLSSDQGNKKGRILTDEEFIERMKGCKYGIVLAGRASPVTDFKNRREADYMMLKKPLLINYKPNYYNELVEGKHYIYIDEKTDIKSLENQYNIDEIAEAGYQWYLENMTPNSAAKVFRQIINEKLGI